MLDNSPTFVPMASGTVKFPRVSIRKFNKLSQGHSAGSFDRAVNLELPWLIALHTDAPLPAKRRRRDTDETGARAPTVSGIFWQEYQSRDRVKEREESERRGKKKRKVGGRKGGKEGERKKDTADGAWTLRLRDHRLILSFIMFIPQTGIVPVCDVRFFLRSLARRAHQVVIFAGPQIVNEDINLVRALMSTREFIALNVVSSHS